MSNHINEMHTSLAKMNEIQGLIQSQEPVQIAPNPISSRQVNAVDFSALIGKAINHVDQRGQEASAKMTAVDTGKSDDLVGAMVASQKSSLAFSALLQVRNKLLTAYDDVMKMPV